MSKPHLADVCNDRSGSVGRGVPPVKLQEKSLGSVLRDARKAKGLSLDDVADDLCIRTCYLKAFEANKIADMPDAVFAVGFLRNYADFLGLDAEAMVVEFRQLIGISAPKPSLSKVDRSDKSQSDYVMNMVAAKRPAPTGMWQAVSGALGIAAVWFGFSAFEQQKPTPSSDAVLFANTELSVPEGALKAVPDETLASSSMQEALAGAGNSALESEAFAISQSTSPSLSTLSVFPAAKADAIDVSAGTQVRAIEDVWVSFSKLDGSLIWEGVLPAGESYVPVAAGSFTVSTANAGAVQILLDGKREVLGSRGEMIDHKEIGTPILTQTGDDDSAA